MKEVRQEFILHDFSFVKCYKMQTNLSVLVEKKMGYFKGP